MADTGWLDLTTYTVEAKAGSDIGFSNPTNAATENGSYASAINNLPSNDNTDWLRGVNLGTHGIPAGSIIDGIEVRIKRYKRNEYQTPECQDNSLRLVLAGSVYGDDKAVATVWPDSNGWSTTYGGAADDWSTGFDYDDIDSATFGVQICCIQGDAGVGEFYIDVIQVKIYHHPGATTDQEGFRWRNDDGTEITATWIEAQDTDAEIAKETNTRIRFLIDAEGNPAASTFELQYKRSDDAAAEWRKVQVE